MPKRIKVLQESDTGRNQIFKDNFTKKVMSTDEFVCKIQNNEYTNYHIRYINGTPTPVSNPDSTRDNNLG